MQKQLAHYELHEQLGQGGMGVVYRATDTLLNRPVAIKFLSQHLSLSEIDRQRFVREATSASGLDHPNICTIYQIGTSETNDIFIAMACYEGRTLRDLLADGLLPTDRLVDIAMQTAAGIAKAHGKGVIHRDIKPGNLLITTEGVVKILDFGLARNASDSDNLTETGEIFGTLKYMSPEQMNGHSVDHRGDLWALGVVLYEMATGSKPFEGAPLKVMDLVRKAAPTPVQQIVANLPQDLVRVIDRSLSRSISARYQSADELIADLRKIPTTSATDPTTIFRTHQPEPTQSVRSTATGAESESDRPEVPDVPTIAVLPFEGSGGDREDELLCEGLIDELMHTLASHSQLRVIGRSSVKEFLAGGNAVTEMQAVFGIQAFLSGSVRRIGNRVRVVANFVNAADGEQVWSEKYDREIEDVFELQDELAAKIASRLEVELTVYTSGLRRASPYQGSIETYELYMKGRHFWNERQRDKSLEYYQAAIDRDPNFALAHAGLANYHAIEAIYGGADPKTIWPRVRECVLRALELDRNLSEAQGALGYLRTYSDRDWDAAHRAFREAVRLAPGSVDSRINLSMHYLQKGELETAWEEIVIAKQIDPLSPVVLNFEIAWHLYARQFETAVEFGDRAIETSSNFDIRLFRALALQKAGRLDEAVDELEALHKLAAEAPLTAGLLGTAYADAGRLDAANTILTDLKEAATQRYVPGSAIAVVEAATGQIDSAFASLEDAADSRDSVVCYANVWPGFDYLRADDRFDRFLERLGLVLGVGS